MWESWKIENINCLRPCSKIHNIMLITSKFNSSWIIPTPNVQRICDVVSKFVHNNWGQIGSQVTIAIYIYIYTNIGVYLFGCDHVITLPNHEGLDFGLVLVEIPWCGGVHTFVVLEVSNQWNKTDWISNDFHLWNLTMFRQAL
jgi:hypothetical protein